MKGYHTNSGYMGYVLGKGYQLFETEDAYYEWYEAHYGYKYGEGDDA